MRQVVRSEYGELTALSNPNNPAANTTWPQSGVTFRVVQRAVALVEYLVFNYFSFGTGGDGRAPRNVFVWLGAMP
jgi:hypothetical protein